MYSACIVEDCRTHADLLRSLIAESPWSAQVAPVDVLESLAAARACANRYDIAFVDIDLQTPDQGDGIQLAREIAASHPGTQVIFVSGYLEYAPLVYGTEHVWFLAKPVESARLDEALSCAIDALDHAKDEALFLNVGSGTVRVFPREIVYAESRRHKVRVITRTGTLEVYGSLDDLGNLLPSAFLRCHKSFLVNMECIELFGKSELTLADGAVIPVSQRRRRAALEQFTRYAERML